MKASSFLKFSSWRASNSVEILRGKRLATFLLVEAADGYQAVFALPELDPAFTDKLILLADKRDGQQLSKTESELRLIVPDEKKRRAVCAR